MSTEPIVVSLRGANGAGKSTIARAVMRLYPRSEPIRVPGRANPIGAVFSGGAGRSLFVPGHYGIKNGGIDTISSLDQAYDLIWSHSEAGMDVLYEGKNLSDGVTRIQKFSRQRVLVVVVNHPYEDCVASVRARGHSIKEESIRKTHAAALRHGEKLRRLGYDVRVGGRYESLIACVQAVTGWKTPWIGVDFDHTLRDTSGAPVGKMVERVRRWLSEGREVRIVTSRVNPLDYDDNFVRLAEEFVREWCERHIGVALRVQSHKSAGLSELWDDLAVPIVPDDGEIVTTGRAREVADSDPDDEARWSSGPEVRA